VAKVLLARRGAASTVEQFAGQTSLLRLDDILEDVTLSEDLCAGIDFEGVLAVCVEVVVHGVEESVAADLGGAARGVVDVVLLEGDEVV
jgi:hypothetical protein